MEADKEILTIQIGTANDVDPFLETLKKLFEQKPGRLDKQTMEKMDTELVKIDFAPSENGTVSRSYLESHSVDVHGLDIVPATTSGRLSQEYLERHNVEVGEPGILKKSDFRSTDRKLEQKQDNFEPRVPFDVVVTLAFLEKRTVRCCGSSVFLYNDELGCFEELNEPTLHVAIRESLPTEMDLKLNKQKISDVVHRIVSSPKLQIRHDEFDSHIHLLNFRNGVYDINTETMLPHSPAYLFTSCLDAEFENSPSQIQSYGSYTHDGPANQGYYFDRFLEDCTGGDPLKMKSLQQLTGYIISNEWRAKKFFVLIGLPHTGKSVWLSLWRSLIGPKHTTAMSLKQLGETRFMTAELFRSKLNISAEMDESSALKATDIIKAITGGDLLTAEKKGKDPFQFYGKTKLVAAGNHMPLLNKLDGTTALTDRILFLIFNNSAIPEEKRDKSLLDKLINEKTHIVEWALEGYLELLEQNLIFTESEDAKAFKKRYIKDLNNVLDFVKDRCHIDLSDKECKAHRKDLYKAYQQFCYDNGLRAIGRQEFFVEILKTGSKPGKFRINGSTPLKGFRGIRLLTSTEQQDQEESEF